MKATYKIVFYDEYKTIKKCFTITAKNYQQARIKANSILYNSKYWAYNIYII